MGEVTITLKDDSIRHFINARYSIYPTCIVVKQYDENDKLVNRKEFHINLIKSFSFIINY